MVVFLANRGNIQIRQLHHRLRNRFTSDSRFNTVQFRVSEPRELGPYRVIARVSPQQLLAGQSYTVSSARIEIGFQRTNHAPHEFYWLNWIEPERDFLLGWHQDDTHQNLGPVHLQVNQGKTTVVRESAPFIDKHPMAVVEARIDQLPTTLERVEWDGDDAVGID